LDTPSTGEREPAGQVPQTPVAPSVYDRPLPALDVRAWLAAIGQIGHEANATPSIAAHISRIAEQCCRLLRYDFCAILLAEPTGTRLVVEGAHGLTPEFVERYNRDRPVAIGPQPLGEGPSSRAFRFGRPVAVPDVDHEPLFGPWGDVPRLEAPYQAMLSVPLITRNGAIGVINCYTAGTHEFAEEEIRLVEILADQAAISLEAAALRLRERETIADLERQRQLLERSEAIHRDLTRVVLESAGFPGIARALARLLGAPVLVEDAGGQALASSDPRGSVAELWPGQLGTSPEIQARLAEQERHLQVVVVERGDAGVGRDRRGTGGETSHDAFWVALVTVGKERVGRIWVGPVAGTPGSLELRALEHGTTVVALELLKQRAAQEVEWRVRGDLLGDLLAERIEDEPALRARARRLGHDLSGRHEVIAIRPTRKLGAPTGQLTLPDPGLVQALLDLVSRTVDGVVGRTAASKPLVARYRDHVVVLGTSVDGADGRGALALAQQILAGVLRLGHSALIALSPPAEQLADLASAARMALGALNLAERAGRRDEILTLDRLDVYGLLLQVERPEALERFANGLLDPLATYDRERGAELLKSLRAYLDHRMSIADAAAALVVHPHTLRYRLARIEALLGLSLRETEGLLRLRMAVMIRDIVAP
jgi:sugar diacid utilization regulator